MFDGPLQTAEDRKRFVMNLICFVTCIEGLFFFAAFAYVYFLRSKGLLNGLPLAPTAARDESMHMNFALEVINTVRLEEPELFDDDSVSGSRRCSKRPWRPSSSSSRTLGEGVLGMSTADTRTYLEFVADQRLAQLGLPKRFGASNPFAFMELQDVQELELLRAHRVGLSGRGRGRSRLRRGLLADTNDLASRAPPKLPVHQRAQPSDGRPFHQIGRPSCVSTHVLITISNQYSRCG